MHRLVILWVLVGCITVSSIAVTPGLWPLLIATILYGWVTIPQARIERAMRRELKELFRGRR